MQRIFVFGDYLTAPEIQNRLQDSYDVQRLQELCARAIHQLVGRRDYPEYYSEPSLAILNGCRC